MLFQFEKRNLIKTQKMRILVCISHVPDTTSKFIFANVNSLHVSIINNYILLVIINFDCYLSLSYCYYHHR
jgi:hypothetical protein